MRFTSQCERRYRKLFSEVEAVFGKPGDDLLLLPVIRMRRDDILWKGIVVAFEVPPQPNGSSLCYAWFVDEGEEARVILKAVSPSISTAEEAVTAWLDERDDSAFQSHSAAA